MSHKDIAANNNNSTPPEVDSVLNNRHDREFSTSSLFTSIYSRNCDDIFYGLGQLAPCNPFLLQSLDSNQPNYLEIFGADINEIEENGRRRDAMKEIIDDFINENVSKEGHKYTCKIDDHQFNSESMLISHMRQSHRNTIEEMLHVLAAEDNELFFVGHFFSKLFYSDFMYPTARKDPCPAEFPSVAAPDIEEIRRQTKSKREKKRKDNKDTRKEIIDVNNAIRKERRVLTSKHIFTEEEIEEIDKKIFGDYPFKRQQSQQPTSSTDLPKKVEPLELSTKEIQEKPSTIVDTDKDVTVADDKKSDGSTFLKIPIERKLKKQLEEDIFQEILDEVVYGLCTKMGPRILQEAKKREAKEKEEAEMKAKAEEEAKKELLLVAERERKVQERKIRREARKQESEKLTEEITDELINMECVALAEEVLGEFHAVLAQQSTPFTPSASTPFTIQAASTYSPVWTPAPSVPSYAPRLVSSTPPPAPMVPAALTSFQCIYPMVVNDPRFFNSRMNIVVAPPPVVPMTLVPTTSPYSAVSDITSSSDYPEFHHQPILPTEDDDELDIGITTTESLKDNPLFSSAFGTFGASEQHKGDVGKTSTTTSSSSFTTSSKFPEFTNRPSLPASSSTTAPSKVMTESPPSTTSTSSSSSTPTTTKFLKSFPEDYGFNSSRCLVCRNLPFATKRGEVVSFFKDCTISLASDFSTKIQFLKGVDEGCCFVEFETAADLDRALLKSGGKLGESIIEVTRPPGVLTSESGQKFALNATARNAVPSSVYTAENAQPQATSVKTSELNPAATEFRPINYVSQSSSYSLSSMLHTENDAVVVANKKKDLTGSVGNKTPEVTPNNNVHRVTTTTTTNTTNKKLLPSGIGLSDDEDEEDSTMEFSLQGAMYDLDEEDDEEEDDEEEEDDKAQEQEKDVAAEEAFMDRFLF